MNYLCHSVFGLVIDFPIIEMGSTGFDSESNWKVSRSRTEVILVNKRLHTFYTAKETTLLLHNLNHSKISLVLPGRKAGFSSKALVYSV